MELLSISHGGVTLRLSLEQCAALAQSSEFAATHSFDDKTEMWQSQAAFFLACAMAACAQWHMNSDDAETVAGHLDRLGLTELTIRAEEEYVEISPAIQALLRESFLAGRRQTTLIALRQTVLYRFGPASTLFEPALETLDLALLDQLLVVALTAVTLAEFEAVCRRFL